MPLVSIIVPNYNHADYLEARLQSVLEQTFTDVEIILLDDCSTDASLDVIARYRHHPKVVHCIVNETNSGSTFHQWASGIACARGEYVWIAESDDLAAPAFLSTLCSVLDTHPAVGLAYCQSAKIDAAGMVFGSFQDQTASIPGNPWRRGFVAAGRAMLQHYFLHTNVVPNASAVLFRRHGLPANVLQEAATYTINGDWFVWSNLLLGADIAFVNEHYNLCRFHALKGSTRNVLNFNNIAEFYRLRGFLYDALALPDAQRQGLNAGLFKLWMTQRRSMRVSKNDPETFKVMAAAERVDPMARARLAAEAE